MFCYLFDKHYCLTLEMYFSRMKNNVKNYLIIFIKFL
nr:MAG TPA: hypothetical protein [Ackermannviridae sp.]